MLLSTFFSPQAFATESFLQIEKSMVGMVFPWSALTFTTLLIFLSLPTHLSSLQTKSTGIQLLLSETETYWKSASIKDLADQEYRYTASFF